jgi:hypothetical protein
MSRLQESDDVDLPTQLSAEQTARVEALRAARQVLATVQLFASELSGSSAGDLIAVARYILDGSYTPIEDIDDIEDIEDDAGDLMDLDSVAAGEGRLTVSGTSMDAP